MALSFEPIGFDQIPGWEVDDHAVALSAFARSHARLLATCGQPQVAKEVCEAVKSALSDGTGIAARRLFETFFIPQLIHNNPESGLVTGYYEPHLQASRVPTSKFPYPVYRRPPDLEDQMDESLRGSRNGAYTHLRRTPAGLIPFPARREIDLGALDGCSLELAYVADPVDLYFLHIQGSGVLHFPDASMIRITYDGKNGHPYTSIGRHLIDRGLFTMEELTLPVLGAWLSADPERGRHVMWVNESYIFFRELSDQNLAPLGVGTIPLTAGRSLAVDGGIHPIGTPIFVVADGLPSPERDEAFNRLMIAQDAGSAIRGAERGDIYYGSGATAGKWAGTTKHPARFIVFRLRSPNTSSQLS